MNPNDDHLAVPADKSSSGLPPLPNGAYGVWTDYYDGTCLGEPFDRWHDIELFSAEQMRAYALEERERCARLCDDRAEDCRESFDSDGDERWLVYAKHADRLAAAIRSPLTSTRPTPAAK